MTRVMGGSLALLAVLLAVLAPAAAQRGAERFGLRLSFPKGYCLLDPGRRADAALINRWEEEFARGEQLLVAAVPCDQRDAGQFLILSGSRHDSKSYDERARVPQKLCE